MQVLRVIVRAGHYPSRRESGYWLPAAEVDIVNHDS